MPSLLRVKNNLFYGWVVLASLSIIGTIIHGSYNSFGVFFKSIEAEFGLNRATTSVIFSAYMVLTSIFGPIGGWALDRYGPRIVILMMSIFTGLAFLLTSQTNDLWQLFITYSLLLALGSAATYIATMATVSRWFDKKRGLSLGIVGSSTGLGAIVIVPLATYLISSFDWRMAYIVLGLIVWLTVIPLSRLLRKDPYEIGSLPDGVKSSSGRMGIEERETEETKRPVSFSLMQALRNRNFWFFSSIWLQYSLCFYLILTHIVPYATDIGIPAIKAATILSVMGGSNIAGKIIMGRVSDIIGRKETAITCTLLLAGAMIWLIWSGELWMLYLFGVVFGFSVGGLDPSVNGLIGDAFGLRNLGVIMGTLSVAWGIGAAIGSFAGGLIFDVNNSYTMAFLIGALVILTAALPIALVRLETKASIPLLG